MSKINIKKTERIQPLFSNIKAYSVNDVIAAGGTTAFASKMGKDFAELIEGLKKFPKDAFLTEEEFDEAMKTLNESK